MKKLRVGDGLKGETDQGPLIDAKALAKVENHIADARAKGATVVTGGARHALGGTFYQPTVLTNVSKEMILAREETFGPVAPLFRVDTDEQAVQLANDTEFGLAAYLYTRDLARSWRVTEALEYGIVGLNTGLDFHRGRALRRHEGKRPGTRGQQVRNPRVHRAQVRLRRRDLVDPCKCARAA